MKEKKQVYFWSFLFLAIALLTQSNLLFEFSSSPWLLGFPKWLWLMIGVHLFFVGSLYFFIKNFKDD